MSYRHVEGEQQESETCGGRTELDSSVLNDEWVAVSPFKKFKISAKSPFEERLSECEDQRFELDLVFSRFDDLRNTLQQILSSQQSSELNLIQTRTLSQLYSNEGENLMSLFIQNPMTVAPIILKRLEQKEEEWKLTRDEYESQWNKVFTNGGKENKD